MSRALRRGAGIDLGGRVRGGRDPSGPVIAKEIEMIEAKLAHLVYFLLQS